MEKIDIVGKQSKHEIHVEKLMSKIAVEEPTRNTNQVHLGCTQRESEKNIIIVLE